MSRTSAEQQGLIYGEKAWSWLETVALTDLAAREMPENHKQFVDFLQEDLPESERVKLSGKSELESTHAILKLIPIEKHKTIVDVFFANYYKLQKIRERITKHAPELVKNSVLDAKPQPVNVELGEINQPKVLPEAPILQVPEIKTPEIRQKTIDSTTDVKKHQKTLIAEVLQMS